MGWQCREEDPSPVRHHGRRAHLQSLYNPGMGIIHQLDTTHVCDRAFIQNYPQIMGDQQQL